MTINRDRGCDKVYQLPREWEYDDVKGAIDHCRARFGFAPTASDDNRPLCPNCERRVVKLIYDMDDNIKKCHDCCSRPCE